MSAKCLRCLSRPATGGSRLSRPAAGGSRLSRPDAFLKAAAVQDTSKVPVFLTERLTRLGKWSGEVPEFAAYAVADGTRRASTRFGK